MNHQRMIWLLIATVTLAISLNLPATVLAGDPHGDPGPNHPAWGARGSHQGLVTFSIERSEELGLSEKQVQQLKDIRNRFRKASAPVRAEREEADERFTDLMKSDSMNLGEIEVASKRIESLEHRLRIIFAEAISDGKNTLTPKQLKKVKKLRKRPYDKKRS